MRKLVGRTAALVGLLAMPAAARAADLPVPAPFSWTGFYLGANVGWAPDTWTGTLLGPSFSATSNGRFIAGGQAGFNYQIGAFVAGVEAEGDWVAQNNSDYGVATPVESLQVASNDTWIATLAARFGFAVDRALFYGKAGGGWVGNSFTLINTATGASIAGPNNNTYRGWLAGAGFEWAFAYNWTVKIEYDYLGLGSSSSSSSFTVPATAPLLAGDTFSTGSNRSVQMAKVGINYLFNWSNPVVARY